MFENIETVDKSIFNKYEINMEDLIPKIEDTIVEIYGEKHREVIKNRLRSIVINPYITFEDLRSEIGQSKSKKTNELAVEFLKEIGIEIGIEIGVEEQNKVYKDGTYALNEEHKKILETFFDWYDFRTIGPIFDFDDEKLDNANNWHRENIMKNRCKILKQYGLDISPSNYEQVITSKEGTVVIKRIMEIYEIAKNLKQKYEQWEQDYEQEDKYMKDCQEISNQLDFEYYKEFYKQILPYVSEEDRQNIEKALNSQEKKQWGFIEIADPNGIYNDAFILGSKIEAFQEEYDEIINEESYTAENLREKRIEYFKQKGIDLGDDYSLYENSEEVKKVWPDKDTVAKICEIKEKLFEAKEKELLYRTSNYLECKDKLSKLNLALSHGFNINLVREGVICAVPNFVKNVDEEDRSLSVIHLPILRLLKEYKDVNVIHEILHIVEYSKKNISEEKILLKTGFEILEDEIPKSGVIPSDNDEVSDEMREYEIFSENIHQSIAIEVTEKLHEKGIYLFDDPKIAKTRGATSYEQMNPITMGFIKVFSQEIKDARINEDLSDFYAVIGEQNLKELNSIVNEYRSLNYYKMMSDVIEKKDTELTRKRNELINKAIEITKKMKEHNKEQDYEIKTQKIGQATVNQPYTSKKIATSVLKETVEKIKEGEQSLDGR